MKKSFKDLFDSANGKTSSFYLLSILMFSLQKKIYLVIFLISSCYCQLPVLFYEINLLTDGSTSAQP